jgi:hypothetical protein
MKKTQIVEIETKHLKPAPWNYKVDGTPEEIEKLIRSIRRDGSVGVLAVREIDDGGFEVIDGNHRLQAVRQMKWGKVHCENFGEISQAEAVVIARRRNHSWFEDDAQKFGKLLKDVVVPEIDVDELEQIMPDTADEMQRLIDLANFSFDNFDEGEHPDDEQGFKTLALKLPEDQFAMWKQWCDRCESLTEYNSPEKFFELAIAEALSTPTESHK